VARRPALSGIGRVLHPPTKSQASVRTTPSFVACKMLGGSATTTSLAVGAAHGFLVTESAIPRCLGCGVATYWMKVSQFVTPYQHSYKLVVKITSWGLEEAASVRLVKVNLRMIPERSTLL
jgi:hypothetical protein